MFFPFSLSLTHNSQIGVWKTSSHLWFIHMFRARKENVLLTFCTASSTTFTSSSTRSRRFANDEKQKTVGTRAPNIFEQFKNWKRKFVERWGGESRRENERSNDGESIAHTFLQPLRWFICHRRNSYYTRFTYGHKVIIRMQNVVRFVSRAPRCAPWRKTCLS